MPSDTDPKPLPAILSRVCTTCGKPSAPFGFADPMRGSDPGKWYCFAHRAIGQAEFRRGIGAT